MKRVSTKALRPSRAFVTRATRSALLDIQMTYIVSCLAAAKNKQMIQVAMSVLAISLQVNLLLRPVTRSCLLLMLLLHLLHRQAIKSWEVMLQ
ncbi:hypothetical protein ACHAWC_008324 [Mediolabrus comicus]